MYRVGFLGLLLFSAALSYAQTSTIDCSREWRGAEVDPCLLSFSGPAPMIDAPTPAAEEPKASPFDPSAATVKVAPEGNEAGASLPALPAEHGFQWGAALQQSARLLAFQQGMMLATDKWARYSLTHGKFFQDYFDSVRGGLRQWDDGDPFLDNYVGHPLQGAVAGFVQVQNDPRGRKLSIGKSGAYWKSRLKAMGWIAAYSTQFEIGPVSESSIENLGSFNYRNCPTCQLTRGAGWVDLVVTPTLGTAWLLGEDALDRFVIRRIEGRLGRGKWSNFFRCALNPARVAANTLRLKAPWYRDNRDEAPLVAIAK